MPADEGRTDEEVAEALLTLVSTVERTRKRFVEGGLERVVCRMEDMLGLYEEPYDPLRPKVCFDEVPYQLVAQTHTPLPARPGKPAQYDYEYKRSGTCNLFICFEFECGWRHVEVTERRTKLDFAHQMRALVDVHYPQAGLVRVVLDNLDTHTGASL